jgi:hypothetical protein
MKKQHILFSNYHWEDDEYGKDHYDYARENIWEADDEHIFADEDYTDGQLRIEGCEVYTCPICGEEFDNLAEAKQCCRDEKWETMADIPDEEVYREVQIDEEFDWDDLKVELGHFIEKSEYGLLLCGEVGRWNGTSSGGCYVNKFDDLYKFWKDCDYIKIYDERGHLHIKASHHDGNNYAELKELTQKGVEYRDSHRWDSDREVHEKLWNSNFFTRLPHYAHKVWGCKKGA